MRKVKVAVLALLASWAVGCISVDSLVKVKADGSGTIEQTMLVNGSALGMLSMMGAQGGAEMNGKLDPEALFSQEKLQAEAGNLGEGVTLVSSTPVTQGEMKGVKAVYAFKDFNALRVSTSVPDLEEAGARVGGKGERLPMVLTKNGGTSLITLDMLRMSGAEGTAAPAGTPAGPPEIPKELMAMLAPMLKDMRVAIAVEPQGQLVRTNATHVQGQRVTLFDVAIGEVFADPSGLTKLQALGNNPSVEQIRAAFKGVKGIRINEVDRLEIEFR
jgi:hypothetical protein